MLTCPANNTHVLNQVEFVLFLYLVAVEKIENALGQGRLDHEEEHNDWYDQVSKEWNFESFITNKAQDSPEYKDEEYENQRACWHDE